MTYPLLINPFLKAHTYTQTHRHTDTERERDTHIQREKGHKIGWLNI